VERISDRVLTKDCLAWLLHEARRSNGIEQSRKDPAEARATLQLQALSETPAAQDCRVTHDRQPRCAGTGSPYPTLSPLRRGDLCPERGVPRMWPGLF
jgi:hypothetical protein